MKDWTKKIRLNKQNRKKTQKRLGRSTVVDAIAVLMQLE
jgi:hypothetical protein